MLISRNWIQEYCEDKLPSAAEIAEALTMHSFEVESVEKIGDDDVLDVKVLPNRAHDALSHRGIARETTVLLDLKFKDRDIKQTIDESVSDLEIKIEEPKLCLRYVGKKIENIEVKDSPDWLRRKLESLGERSINNVVDITNFVMFDLGQPMHAFDADKLDGQIQVRLAKKGEKITLLGGEEVELDETMLVIADDKDALAIAGVKGGQKAEVTKETKNIIFEAANFDHTSVRKTSQKTGIKNHSSKRFENEISPEVCGVAMQAAALLIKELASTPDSVIYQATDVYPREKNQFILGFSPEEINKILGVNISKKDIENILERFGWQWQKAKPGEKIIESARSFLGVPYKKGASVSFDAPRMFDCSSFTSYLFSQAGVPIPRISIDQYVFAQKVSEDDLKEGDLIFSNTGNGSIRYETVEWAKGTKVPEGVDHVGLYVGDGEVIHATKSIGAVCIEKLSESNQFKNIAGFGRAADLNKERYVIKIPFERLDLITKEDLAEEIGRVYGYEKIKPELPEGLYQSADINRNFEMVMKARKALIEAGFSEVYNYALGDKGQIELENPAALDKRFLRTNLKDGLLKSLELNYKNSPLLGLKEIKIFEIGTVFAKDKNSGESSEQINVAWGIKNKKESKIEEYALESISPDSMLGELLAQKSGETADIFSIPHYEDASFRSISPYPFVLRDIAVWTTKGTEEKDVLKIILENSGELLVRYGLFDRFEKPAGADGEVRISYAFNLVFQSQDRTLTDTEINEIMTKITNSLNSKNGWQVR